MDFNSFGVDTTFDAEEVLNESGDYLLPDMTGAVLGVTGFEEKSNQSGWQAVSYELQVLSDGGDGKNNGRTFKHQITVANPSFPDSATWGFQELKRWAAAMGLTQLGSAQDFVGGQFSANIGRKAQKNDPTRFNQTVKMVKPVETAQPAAQPKAQPQAQQPQGFGGQGGFGQQPQGGGFGQHQGGFGRQ